MSSLSEYEKKRRFDQTPEPRGSKSRRKSGLCYVIQKHDASRLHYDFRLEWNGVLWSWAVPKGPSLDPSVKSLAVHVEDHPVDYADFEGVIPKGQYGGGTVMVWDSGTWVPPKDPTQALKSGKLSFDLHGQKLQGHWTLIRIKDSKQKKDNWLLIKGDDEYARSDSNHRVVEKLPHSVKTKRSLEQIGQDHHPSSVDVDPKAMPHAKRKKLPKSFQPQLAIPADDTPSGDQWLHEIKFDGYRILARVEDDVVRLITRRGNDWTDRFPSVRQAIEALNLRDTIFDGEVVVLDTDGTTNFQALQNVMNRGEERDICYYVFDLPFFDGYDLTSERLIDRKAVLAEVLGSQAASRIVRYSDHISGQGRDVFSHACDKTLEGIISKRANAFYVQKRSDDWVKSKCLKRQEFVVGGWTDPSGSREGFGALLLGYYQGDDLQYAGRVGTGFNRQSLHDVRRLLDKLERKTPAYSHPPSGQSAKGVHWVTPQLIAEVEFNSWTDGHLVRQASFHGLREDKKPEDIVREEPQPVESIQSKRSKTQRTTNDNGKIAGVHLTHPQRILYPDQGITKRELAEYYEAVADWVMPHLKGRPVTLVRCPKGRDDKCFYQKHLTQSMSADLSGVKVEEDGSAIYVLVNKVKDLILLAQMSVLELHPWPAREDRLDRPDQLVFDLDPAESVNWSAVVDAAWEVRQRLEDHHLTSFVRLTGGKGAHVVAPIDRYTDWQAFKEFAKKLAHEMAKDSPNKFVATASKAKRQGKVFIDYLRNQRGATAVASYSTRAKPGCPIATPIRWDELTSSQSPDQYHVRNILKRLSSLKADPWEGFGEVRQRLSKR